MIPYTIGFDVGGTRLKSGGVTRQGKLLAQGVASSGANLGPEVLLKSLINEVERISRTAKAKPRSIGLALPGGVHPNRGIVALPGKLDGLEGYPLVPKLQKAVGIPVVAENDGRVSILAEKHFGLARNKKWAVSLTLGTGVGSGVMLDGQILRDPHLQFGTQMGHIVIQAAGGRLCLTGARGTATMLCSATALAMPCAMDCNAAFPRYSASDISRIQVRLTARLSLRPWRTKIGFAWDELRHWTTNLGWLLVSAVHVYAPDVIILSGGVTHGAGEQAHLSLSGQAASADRVSRMQDHAGVLGAGAVAWELILGLSASEGARSR
jgi:glucokinase